MSNYTQINSLVRHVNVNEIKEGHSIYSHSDFIRLCMDMAGVCKCLHNNIVIYNVLLYIVQHISVMANE